MGLRPCEFHFVSLAVALRRNVLAGHICPIQKRTMSMLYVRVCQAPCVKPSGHVAWARIAAREALLSDGRAHELRFATGR